MMDWNINNTYITFMAEDNAYVCINTTLGTPVRLFSAVDGNEIAQKLCKMFDYETVTKWIENDAKVDAAVYDDVVNALSDMNRAKFASITLFKNRSGSMADATRTESYEYVNKPSHYGGTQCIENMRALYGDVATYWFCILSAYKYRFREGHKPGEEVSKDESKAKWYEQYAIDNNLIGGCTWTK